MNKILQHIKIRDKRIWPVHINNKGEINGDSKENEICVSAHFLIVFPVFLFAEVDIMNSSSNSYYQIPCLIEGDSDGQVLNVAKVNGGGRENCESTVSVAFTLLNSYTPYQSDFFFINFGGISFQTNEQFVSSNHSSSFVTSQWVVINPFQRHVIESEQFEYEIKESMGGRFIQSYHMKGFAFVDTDYAHSFMSNFSYNYSGNNYCSGGDVQIYFPIGIPIGD